MNPEIIYEDNHIIAVEKKPGTPTQGDITGIPSLLDITRDYIKNKYNKPGNVYLGMMHRLDKPVSGLVVFARTSKAAARLTLLFQTRSVVKIYLALIECNDLLKINKWTILEHNIRRRRGFTEISGDEDDFTQEARLEYLTIISDGKYALVLVNLLTGRKHQIRAQFSSIGMPIVGDSKYGSQYNLKDKSICLHSYYMKFTHPTQGNSITLRSTIPERFKKFLPVDNNICAAINIQIEKKTALPDTSNSS